MEKLTPKQEKALDIIIKTIKHKGYPPTLKDLADELGASSRNTAVKYLNLLVRKGYIVWERKKARGIQLVEHKGKLDQGSELSLPLVGSVTAGLPILAEENIERYVAIPSSLIRPGGRYFLLRVQGDSMIGAGILNNDLVVVRSQSTTDVGGVVVALIDGEATVKRLAVRQNQHFLKAENPEYPDIYPQSDWSIQGKVIALIREDVD